MRHQFFFLTWLLPIVTVYFPKIHFSIILSYMRSSFTVSALHVSKLETFMYFLIFLCVLRVSEVSSASFLLQFLNF